MGEAKPRAYLQVARAAASEDIRQRIVAAFQDALRERWMDEITLDSVAASARTTRRTVIRMFGGKDGLVAAASQAMTNEVATRRAVPRGASPAEAARALMADYEVIGDMIIRLLAQEERHGVLTPFLDNGRAFHRGWVEGAFAPSLARLSRAKRARRTDQLIAAADIYVWKLLRRDFNRGAAEVEVSIAEMLNQLLEESPS